MHKNHSAIRIGTDTDNSTYFTKDPLRTLLFGFRTEFIFIPDFWANAEYGDKKSGQNKKLVFL